MTTLPKPTNKNTLKYWVLFYAYEALALLKQNGYDIPLHNIEINNRITKSVGKAYFKGGLYGIIISGKSYTSDAAKQSESLKNTVYHEVAHIADKFVYGKFDHGKTWKGFMVMLGQEPNVSVTAEELKQIDSIPLKKTRHLYECIKCGAKHALTNAHHNKLQAFKSIKCSCGGHILNLGKKVDKNGC